LTIVLYAVYCIIMRIELPKHYPAFVVNYKTSHKCTNGSTCGQYLITYIIAVDKADAEDVTSTGWTVKTKSRGKWYTVCDTWAGPTGMNAEERAKEIAALLNK